MRAFYAARLEDLGLRDLVKIECACGHRETVTAAMLRTAGVKEHASIADLKWRLRCRECDQPGGTDGRILGTFRRRPRRPREPAGRPSRRRTRPRGASSAGETALGEIEDLGGRLAIERRLDTGGNPVGRSDQGGIRFMDIVFTDDAAR